MKTSTIDDLKNALAEFQHRAAVLQSLMDEDTEPRGRATLARWLPGLPATMLSIVALGLAVYVAAGAAPPVVRADVASSKSVASARLFALFPDGRVELSDPWSGRRLFRWDGRQWRVVEAQPPLVEGAPSRDARAAADRAARER